MKVWYNCIEKMTNTALDSRLIQSHLPQVLVVDDDASIRGALDTKFTKAGFVVTLCQDGEEGLAALRQQRFNMVVLDVNMPGKSGIDVLKEISETQNAQTPTFVLTAQADHCDEVCQLGARRCFLKLNHPLRDVVASICKEVSAV